MAYLPQNVCSVLQTSPSIFGDIWLIWTKARKPLNFFSDLKIMSYEKKCSLWTLWHKTVCFLWFWMLSKSSSGKKKVIPFCQVGCYEGHLVECLSINSEFLLCTNNCKLEWEVKCLITLLQWGGYDLQKAALLLGSMNIWRTQIRSFWLITKKVKKEKKGQKIFFLKWKK